MNTVTNHEKDFISLFNQTARYHHRYQVFEDFISCSVIALQNGLQFCDKREAKYMRIVSRYEKTDMARMAQLLAHVVNGLEYSSGDFLGSIFMQLDLGDKYRGQFFTPWSIGVMMARLQLGVVAEQFRDKPFITLSEPACGAGCMALAFAWCCVRRVIRRTDTCGYRPLTSIRWLPAWRIFNFAVRHCRRGSDR
jgi:type I restriction-modification system DNA methylase subunit